MRYSSAHTWIFRSIITHMCLLCMRFYPVKLRQHNTIKLHVVIMHISINNISFDWNGYQCKGICFCFDTGHCVESSVCEHCIRIGYGKRCRACCFFFCYMHLLGNKITFCCSLVFNFQSRILLMCICVWLWWCCCCCKFVCCLLTVEWWTSVSQRTNDGVHETITLFVGCECDRRLVFNGYKLISIRI